MAVVGSGKRVPLPWDVLLQLLLVPCLATGSELHSLKFFSFAVSEPSPGVPEFGLHVYLDDHFLAQYDSEKQKLKFQNKRIENRVGHGYIEKQILQISLWQDWFQSQMQDIMSHYHHSGGSHTFQNVIGCEIQKDNSSKGIFFFGYDGEDYISYDLDKETWTTKDSVAKITEQKWNATEAHRKSELLDKCVQTFQDLVKYKKYILDLKERPSGLVTQHTGPNREMILKCWVFSFSSPNIVLSWLKDGEEMEQDTKHSKARPSGDGTYQKWASVEIPPGEKEKYICRVKHGELSAQFNQAWELEPDSLTIWVIAFCLVAVLFFTLVWIWNCVL
ncbi:class I histocompatibility antigen, Non-RT1.A alpha-1 chain-like [Ornithorhynchus anatinus]|uniref:Ig-like domain-containing protein n=1 Tax=Ornithorhynchus anatinus TaxID=9258 RepID=F7GBN2_ORNAN|nr:class I histocompatibility antigen, Non-RT1.A alpha-1 chain-like [Ornithorhynchus anatinus]XP_007654574.2 class I histocompatibility antigen, Non-RT1.A alpha-1 chain-like [Ornithorhynchus anatinus]